jgi:hypothetical protein
MHGEVRNVYKILVGKPKGRREDLNVDGRDNIGMDPRKIEGEIVDWIQLPQHTVHDS